MADYRNILLKTGKMFSATLSAAVAIMLAVMTGFGMFHLSYYILEYPLPKAHLYSFTLAAAAGAWTAMLVQKKIFYREGKLGFNE